MTPPSGATVSRPRVVIVGGGFAGVAAAGRLRGVPVDVTLIDRTNHFLFQPLLYQVATGLLSAADVAVPTRSLLRRQRNVEVLLADIDMIDLADRRIVGDGGALRLSYDFLIVATGARHFYFGHDDWERFAPGLKTLDDAREIRARFLLAFEDAEKVADTAERDALLTFVIVGGGPTGVELAGILPTIARKGIRREFRRMDPARVKVILLEGGPRLLPSFPDDLSARARRDLEELGVQCRTNAMVTRVDAEAVYLGEERIPARTVFWAAGNAASPLIRSMGVPLDGAGRALVSSDLSVPDHPEVFVVGDAAAALLRPATARAGHGVPGYVPGVAPAANQMGEHAARMIQHALTGRSRRPFVYRDRGSLAVIGRGFAIADFGRIRLTGRLAWFTWLFVHLLYLANFRNRLSVLVDWGYAYFTYRPGARLVSIWDRPAPARTGTNRGGHVGNPRAPA
jgi:NADH:ubiquinone reductase (H+-translocating)